ncbi:MAG: hypothetical protein JWN96_193, partial [Mycobacterium sp.]|nr:hypothetical protein [Mycobacterium sp.]
MGLVLLLIVAGISVLVLALA